MHYRAYAWLLLLLGAIAPTWLEFVVAVQSNVFVVQRLLGAGSDKTAGRVSSRQQKPAAGVSEHLCPVCGGRFVQPSDLAVHLGKIHNIKTEIVDATDHLALTDSLAMQLYRDHDVHTSPALSVN